MNPPTGRKPGRPRNLAPTTRLLIHDRLQAEVPALVDAMLKQARLGDTRALQWCLDRALTPPPGSGPNVG